MSVLRFAGKISFSLFMLVLLNLPTALEADENKATMSPDQPLGLEQGVKLLLQTDPPLIFVGEDHHNTHLAEGLLALLLNLNQLRPVKCLFIEYPSDFQSDVDAAVAQIDPARLYKPYVKQVQAVIVKLLTRYGVASQEIAEYTTTSDALIDKADASTMETASLSVDLLFFLRRNDIALLAYNVDSQSREFAKGSYYAFIDELRSQMSKNDIAKIDIAKIDLAKVREVSTRNEIMAANIIAMGKAHNCENAVVVVGTLHLEREQFLKSQLGPSLSFTPLQELMSQAGYPSTVVIAHTTDGNLNTPDFILDVDTHGATKFEGFAGNLMTP